MEKHLNLLALRYGTVPYLEHETIGYLMYQGLAYTGGGSIVLLFLGRYFTVTYMQVASLALLVLLIGVVILLLVKGAFRINREKK